MKKLFFTALGLGLLVCAGLLNAQTYAPAGTPSANNTIPFTPLSKTSWLATSTTSASIALGGLSAPQPVTEVEVGNNSSAWAFVIACSSSSCTASAGAAGTSTSDYFIAPGADKVLTVPAGTTYVAAVLATGTGILYVTSGVGL